MDPTPTDPVPRRLRVLRVAFSAQSPLRRQLCKCASCPFCASEGQGDAGMAPAINASAGLLKWGQPLHGPPPPTASATPERLSLSHWQQRQCSALKAVSYTHLTLPTICSV